MYNHFQIALKYCSYQLNAANGKGHGIHSPFVFEWVTKVLNDHRHFYVYDEVEQLREKLLHNKTPLNIEDFGAGSVKGNNNIRTIASITKHAAKPRKLAQLLFRMVQFYNCTQILELGTSMGISTAYLSASSGARVTTMEGSSTIAQCARQHFSALSRNNIQIVTGNFDETLPATLPNLPMLDLVFMDGNHRMEPTIRYFETLLPHLQEHAILIVDDIHWSSEMEQAWKYIQQHESVTLTIDLFFIGLVFFKKEVKTPQHFVIRF